jgi:rhodanese-related sulfurtransferase
MKTILFFILSLTGISLFAQKQLGTDTIRWEGTALQAKIIVDTNVGNPDFIVLDVRTAGEYGTAHIADAINIDYYSTTFGAQLDALDHNKMYLVHCAGGSRSPKARDSMIMRHFREIYHMYNGINAWIAAGFPTVSGYTGLQALNGTQLTQLYPIPATSLLHIQFESASQGKLCIYDLKGQLLKEETLDPGLQVFEVSEYPEGIYLVKIQSAEGVVSRKISIL